MWLTLMHPLLGTWQEIKPGTLGFTTHWATPARAHVIFLNIIKLQVYHLLHIFSLFLFQNANCFKNRLLFIYVMYVIYFLLSFLYVFWFAYNFYFHINRCCLIYQYFLLLHLDFNIYLVFSYTKYFRNAFGGDDW